MKRLLLAAGLLLPLPLAYAQVPGGGGVTVGDPITGTCANGQVVYSNNNKVGCKAVAGTGTVTSVDGSSSGGTLTATGGPVIAAGTLNFELNLAHANTWTAAQTYNNSMFIMLGSSTGKTTFMSDNAGASDFTLHYPAANDTVALLAAAQTLTNKTISGASNTLTVRLANDISGFGTGIAAALAVNVGSAGAPVLFNGALGTPTSGSALNLTNVPVANATGILPAANGGAGTVNGALKGNGSGAVSQAASTDLSNTANIPLLNVNQSYTKGQAVTPVALTPGSTVSLDASTSNNFTLAAAQNFTLSNPTNLKAGQVLNAWITQDATGSRVMTLSSQYQAAGGFATLVLSTAANAKDLLSCIADTTTTLTCNLTLAIAH